MGSPIFGIARLIRSNALVTIEKSAVSIVDGGTVETFTTLAANVPVLMTQFSEARSGNFGTDASRDDFLVTGTNTNLLNDDTRLLVVSHESLTYLAGRYARIDSSVGHAAGEGGILCARYTCKVSLLWLPGQLSA